MYGYTCVCIYVLILYMNVLYVFIYICAEYLYESGYITGMEHAVVLLALYAYKIHAHTYMHTHTSVDLPMPPGPQSTHLFVVASPLSNQSRIPFSSLDRR